MVLLPTYVGALSQIFPQGGKNIHCISIFFCITEKLCRKLVGQEEVCVLVRVKDVEHRPIQKNEL